MSPDGQCKTFDASANGYVRGEGCGILVLKRLADAEADGDRIWGVIRGTALNQDGASPGLTVPNGAAQERVIRAALKRAGVRASDIDYLEAHGTGTEVGDPIEIDATGAVYARGRDAARPLLIGSVKTNIGHLESAAGAAGLIKTVLAMNRGVIPRHLHFRNPNPEMDWERLPLQVTSTPTPWPVRKDRPPLAGVSGFGWSGTNAHLVLEGYTSPDGAARRVNGGDWIAGAPRPIAVALPASVTAPRPKKGLAPRATRLLPLSGKTDPALREVAGRYLEWLDEQGEALAAEGAASGPPLSDMAWSGPASAGATSITGRAWCSGTRTRCARDCGRLPRRTKGGLPARLPPWRSSLPDRPVSGRAWARRFTKASRWCARYSTAVTKCWRRTVTVRCSTLCSAAPVAQRTWTIRSGNSRRSTRSNVPSRRYGRASAYDRTWCLDTAWERSRPRTPRGVFSLEDGLRLAALRGSLVGALPGEGAMAAVFAPASRVSEALDEHNATSQSVGLCIAADNGAHQVISGPADEIASILERLEAADIRVARLRKSPAYHSAMIEPAMDDLETALSGLDFAPPSLPFVSNLSGKTVGQGEALDAAYWRRQMRAPVAYRACVEALAGMGVDAVVEIGPHAVLGPMTTLAWPSAGGVPEPGVVSSLRRPGTGEEPPAPGSGGGFVEAVAGVYEAGLPIRFDGSVRR